MENEKKWISFKLLNNEKILFNNENKRAYYFDNNDFNVFKKLDVDSFEYFINNRGNILSNQLNNPFNIMDWVSFIFKLNDDYDEWINIKSKFNDSNKNHILLNFLINAFNFLDDINRRFKTLEEIIDEWNK